MAVPRTDTGVPAEKAKVFGRIHFREFGKLARYLRYNWCLLSDKQVAVTSSIGLFNKNVAGCQVERLYITGESWPLAVC